MANIRSLLKGIGILFLSVIVLFVMVFFFTYLTGGKSEVLALFGGEGIGVLVVKGSINESSGAIQSLKRFGRTSRIKAVVVRIDSPGGGVVPTQEIYEEIQKLKHKKPVIASLGSVAASGGYYIASICNRIVANPGTLTGSIGVIMKMANIEELMKKVGVKGYNIRSGPHKDIGSPLRKITNEEKDILQSLVNNVHGQFVKAVSMGREMDEEKVKRLADGRIYSGEQAIKVGLVDQLGNLEDAIDVAAKEGGIEGDPKVVYAQAQKSNWWKNLIFSYFVSEFDKRRDLGLRFEWPISLLQFKNVSSSY